MDLLFQLYQMPSDQGVFWPPVMLILLKRATDAELLLAHSQSASVRIAGMESAPVILQLTSKGREFIAELGVTEL
jgi:hypothetical protein